MPRLPDAVVSSSSAVIKSEPDDVPPPVPSSMDVDVDDDDEIVRTIDVFVCPELAPALHLLQFPLHPVAAATSQSQSAYHTPSAARLRPRHNKLELDYPLPQSAAAGQRQLPDTMCLSRRTFASNAVAPVTHMALGKLNRDGTRLDVVPLLQRRLLQMRPSFR